MNSRRPLWIRYIFTRIVFVLLLSGLLISCLYLTAKVLIYETFIAVVAQQRSCLTLGSKNVFLDSTIQKKEIRLLCWVLTTSKSLKSSLAVKNTWGKRCDKLIFLSDVEDKELGAMNLTSSYGGKNLWEKSRNAFQYYYDHHLNEYDWSLKADIDTYIIVENLRYLLSLYDPDDPIALGMKHFMSHDHLSGGAGYIINRGGTKLLVENAFTNSKICGKTSEGEDVVMGRCLLHAGVLLGDTRDELGKHRFFHHTPDDVISGRYAQWHTQFVKYPHGAGPDAPSNTTVSFHKLKQSSLLYVLEFLIYKLQVVGLDREFQGPTVPALPPDTGAIPKEVLQRFSRPSLKATNMVTEKPEK